MKEFYERINLNFNLKIISINICKLYELGEYVSEQLIEVGYEDFNYILETTSGKYCVKIYNKERTDDDVRKYVDRIELASHLELNTPAVLKIGGSCLQTININNTNFRLSVFEYINGKSFFDLNDIPTTDKIKEIIHQMSIIHSATLDSEFIYDKWTITNFIREYEEKKKYIPIKYKSIFDSLINRLKQVDFNKLTYSFVHGDIISSNVLKDNEGKLYIIDFAVSNYLPRIVDLAVTSCNLCLNPNDKSKTILSSKMILEEYQKYAQLSEYELEVFPLFYDLANAMGILQISYLNSMGESSEEDKFWLDESEKGLSFSDNDFWNKIINYSNKSLKKYMRLEMDNYIILHGSFGSKDGNWFPWLKDKLLKDGKKVDVPQMPVGVGIQNYESWSKELDKLKIDDRTTIIAHSIAPIFVCKYLINKKINVKKLIFVCGFNNYLGIDPDFDAVNSSMFLDNYTDVKKYCNNIICYYSDNDPYVKYDIEKEFANGIANKQYIVESGGHINSESGYTEFSDILKSL